MPQKRVLVPIAPGFEEVEALTVVDILRRAGAEVIMAGTVSGPVEGRNAITIIPDTGMFEIMNYEFDLITLPGGAVGTENLMKDEGLRQVVLRHYARGRLISAICAAPTVLSAYGITEGRTVSAHPGVHALLTKETVSTERVTVDKTVITSMGPGTAAEFAFKLVELLYGKEKVAEVNSTFLALL